MLASALHRRATSALRDGLGHRDVPRLLSSVALTPVVLLALEHPHRDGQRANGS